ncbi:MAG: metallophosphoesterase [Christensenellales bacterium]
MKIYAISDLHLSGQCYKPMGIFGRQWENHWNKIRQSWNSLVSERDIVLLPGDLSWAMRLNEARVDLDAICAMPGKKVILKGNHDYWWSSLTSVKALLFNNTYALQNNCIDFGEFVIAGTRGWVCPGNRQYQASADEKVYIRETMRLELSLRSAKKAAPDARLIGMMHYPPSDGSGTPTGFTDMFEKYAAEHVVYGHLHADSIAGALTGGVRGVAYSLVSCDAADFSLVRVV